MIKPRQKLVIDPACSRDGAAEPTRHIPSCLPPFILTSFPSLVVFISVGVVFLYCSVRVPPLATCLSGAPLRHLCLFLTTQQQCSEPANKWNCYCTKKIWWWIILLPIPAVLLDTLMHSNKGINAQCRQVHTDTHQSLFVLHRHFLEIHKADSGCWLPSHKLLSHCPCPAALSHINKTTVVLLCTYANVLIKCAINNSSPAECSAVETIVSRRQPVSPLMSVFLVVHYLRGGEYLAEPSSLCMFRPADINIWWRSLHTIAARCPDNVHSGLGHVHCTFSEVYTNLLCYLTRLRIHVICHVRKSVFGEVCQPVFMWSFVR